MRKLLLLLFVLSAPLLVTAQEISTEQWSLVTKKTADWCPFCGQYGWTFKNNVLEDIQDKPVVFWMAHHSGGLETSTSNAIVNNIPSSGQPVFYINNDNMNVFSSNIAAKREEFKVILDGLSTFPAFAGVGSETFFDGEKITSTSKVRFLVDLEGGEYWLASYLLDDELIAFQASQGNNAVHENILLHSLQGDNYFGENISNGAVAMNQEFTIEGELDFTGDSNIPDYADGYSIVTILWTRLASGEYVPFNLNSQSIEPLVSTKDVLEGVEVTAFQLHPGEININITTDTDMRDVSISLIDMNGQMITTKQQNTLIAGKNNVQLSTLPLATGLYVVSVQSGTKTKNIQILVQ